MTGKDPIRFKITNGSIEEQTDVKKNQKEANTILIHQVAAMGPGIAVVISEDTMHFISTANIKANVLIQLTPVDSDKKLTSLQPIINILWCLTSLLLMPCLNVIQCAWNGNENGKRMESLQ